MQAQAFVAKWGPGGPAHDLNERAGAQAHFIDLCRVIGVPEPGDADNYCFERGVTRTGAGQGFADVWLRNHFAWEYKAPGKSLDGALRQLMMYALPLDNPPLLVVSDRLRFEIHTHFTGTPSERHTVALEDITRPEVQQLLRRLWTEPERFRPQRSNREITEDAARAFAGTAERLRTETLPDGAVIPADLPAAVRPHASAIARAAKRLTDLRDAWLNPPEWTDRVPEVVPLGMTTSPYPDRIVAKPGFEKELAQCTLTNLYNQRPDWLANAHAALDAAVAAAYGWADFSAAMPDDEILRRLLALNLARAGCA